MKIRALILGLAIFLLASLCAAPAMACPASYVKSKAKDALKSNLGTKFSQIADRYMTLKGVNPTSAQGLAIKPYVVGTSWVDHTWGLNNPRFGWGHRIDQKSVAQCVQDCLGCTHHSQHFGDGNRNFQFANPSQASSFGG